MSIFEEWSHNWFGFWRNPEEHYSLPTMEELMDYSWMPEEKERLIAYLEDAPVAVTSILESVNCTLCGDPIGNPGCFKSDDVWLWPCDLAHYVRSHAVRLPDRMIQDISARQYIAPTTVKTPFEQLPWPNLAKKEAECR